MIPLIIKAAMGLRDDIKLFGTDYPTPDGTCIRDYIHVVDLAKAHVVALQRLLNSNNKDNYETFNLGTGTGSSVLEVIQSFERVSGVKLNYRIAERRAGDITSAGWWAYDGSNWVRGYSGPTTEQLDFGAKSDNIGKFLVAHGAADKADDSTKTKTRLGVSWNGTIVGINYMTKEADTTTQMKIHVNGVVQETFLLTNVNANFTGNETLNTSVNAGDYVEIEYDAGQKPGECTMRLIIEKS